MSKLIFDIETIGEDFELLDDYAKQGLINYFKKGTNSDTEYEETVENLKNEMGFSPLTGQVACIGVLDYDHDRGAVYFQSPGVSVEEYEEDGIRYKALTEKEMLSKFWEFAQKYDEFISFNGRKFDVPFLVLRSAINKVKCSCNLMHYKYSLSQRDGPTHIDLFDQLTFHRESVPKGATLHMFCRAFGIKSPKENGIDGDDVATLFKDGRFLDIARYNVWDLKATKELFQYWETYIRLYSA